MEIQISDLDELKQIMSLDELSEGRKEALNKLSETTSMVYVDIDPYQADIHDTRTIAFDVNEEALKERLQELREEI